MTIEDRCRPPDPSQSATPTGLNGSSLSQLADARLGSLLPDPALSAGTHEQGKHEAPAAP
jgi:hypothetical protein